MDSHKNYAQNQKSHKGVAYQGR